MCEREARGENLGTSWEGRGVALSVLFSRLDDASKHHRNIESYP